MTKLIAVLVFCSMHASLYAQKKQFDQNRNLPVSELAHYINTALNREFDERQDPGVAVSIIHNGRVIIRNRKGVVDLEDYKLIGPHTGFYIASVIKPLTAEVILRLSEKGKIKLHDSIIDILPALPPYMKEVTVLNLLNHSSGIPDYYRHITWREPVIDNAHILSLLTEKSDSLLFTPGEKFDYSNSNFILLAEIAEEVSGISFAKLMQEMIFKRFEMEDSFVFTGFESLDNVATGYRYVNGEFLINDYSRIEFQKGVIGTYNMKTYGAGGMFASQSDLEKWVLNMQKLMGTHEMEMQLQGIKVPEDRYPFLNDVSYRTGWYSSFLGQKKILWHSGEFAGYRSLVMHVPQAGIGLIIAANDGSFSAEEFGLDLIQYISQKLHSL